MFTLAALRNEGFSWQTALSLALASKLAYESGSTVANVTKSGWGFAKCEPLDRGETQGFVAIADDVVLIAFRGTESLGDWIDRAHLVRGRTVAAMVQVRGPTSSLIAKRWL